MLKRMAKYKKVRTKRPVRSKNKSYYGTICSEEGLIWRDWANVKKFQEDFPYMVKMKGFHSRMGAERWLKSNGIEEETYNVFEKRLTEQGRLF